MAERIIALVCVLVALLGCEQTPTKSDADQPVDLSEVSALAAQAYKAKNWSESEQHYATLTRNVPGEPEPWFKLGNIYARTLRPELAVKSYREALIRDPQHVKAWHNMGIVQLRQAASSFEKLELLLEPDDALYEKSVNIQKIIDDLVN
jgi:cytochrome c-type biogenesis protein CcmH/NrfG